MNPIRQLKPVEPLPTFPAPRVWDAERLAAFFGFKKRWVLDMKDDPPPRMAGCYHARFDMESQAMREWMQRRMKPKGEK